MSLHTQYLQPDVNARCELWASSRTRETRGTRGTRQTGEGDSSEGNNYELRLLPRKVMKLLLVFKAAKNSEYSFMLGFKLQGAGQTIEG